MTTPTQQEVYATYETARRADLAFQSQRRSGQGWHGQREAIGATEMTLTGTEAIEFAEAYSLTLNKYNDPTEDAREGLTPDEARAVAREDAELIWLECPVFQIRLSDVPDGAYTEDYLGHDRNCATRKEAEAVVRQFRAAKNANPENFEPAMEAEIVAL